jgi:hypothetical protein
VGESGRFTTKLFLAQETLKGLELVRWVCFTEILLVEILGKRMLSYGLEAVLLIAKSKEVGPRPTSQRESCNVVNYFARHRGCMIKL